MIRKAIWIGLHLWLLQLATFAQKFTIEGKLPATACAKEVKLFLPINREEGEIVQVVPVKDNRFRIEGTQDSCVVAMLEYNSANNIPVKRTLVLERGVITADLEAQRITGTENNDTLQAIIDCHSDDEVLAAIHRHHDDVLGLLLTFDHLRFSSSDKLAEAVKTVSPFFGNHPLVLLEKTFLQGIESTEIGSHFIDFVQADNYGNEHRFSDIVKQNKYTVVDFWASWCGPCCKEMPELISLYEKYKDSGLGVVGVSWDKDRKAWLAGIERLNIPWLQLCDLKGRENAASVAWGVRSIPSIWIINADGIIVDKLLRGQAMPKAINKLFE